MKDSVRMLAVAIPLSTFACAAEPADETPDAIEEIAPGEEAPVEAPESAPLTQRSVVRSI